MDRIADDSDDSECRRLLLSDYHGRATELLATLVEVRTAWLAGHPGTVGERTVGDVVRDIVKLDHDLDNDLADVPFDADSFKSDLYALPIECMDCVKAMDLLRCVGEHTVPILGHFNEWVRVYGGVVAGGSACAVLFDDTDAASPRASFRQTGDVDVWLVDLDAPIVVVPVPDDVSVTISVTPVTLHSPAKLPLQILHSTAENAHGVVNPFDADYIRWGITAFGVVGTVASLIAVGTRRARADNSCLPKSMSIYDDDDAAETDDHESDELRDNLLCKAEHVRRQRIFKARAKAFAAVTPAADGERYPHHARFIDLAYGADHERCYTDVYREYFLGNGQWPEGMSTRSYAARRAAGEALLGRKEPTWVDLTADLSSSCLIATAARFGLLLGTFARIKHILQQVRDIALHDLERVMVSYDSDDEGEDYYGAAVIADLSYGLMPFSVRDDDDGLLSPAKLDILHTDIGIALSGPIGIVEALRTYLRNE